MANWVRYPPFSESFPCGEHAKWRRDTPKRGISAILAQYLMKTRQMGSMPPSAILSREGIAAKLLRDRGVSRTGLLSTRVDFESIFGQILVNCRSN